MSVDEEKSNKSSSFADQFAQLAENAETKGQASPAKLEAEKLFADPGEVSQEETVSEKPVVQVSAPLEKEEEKAEGSSATAAKSTSKIEGDDEPETQLKPLDEKRGAYPWYVVNTYSGYESQARLSLEERIRHEGLEEQFGNILVPQETVVEVVRGEKKTSTRKFFPGYMLVQMDLNDHSWHIVTDTPKVSGFIGDARYPTPLSAEEVAGLLQQMESGAQRPRQRVEFERGDPVKVIDGPFAEFNGTVDEVKPDKGKVKVLISIFGRNTPVVLDFGQVEKA